MIRLCHLYYLRPLLCPAKTRSKLDGREVLLKVCQRIHDLSNYCSVAICVAQGLSKEQRQLPNPAETVQRHVSVCGRRFNCTKVRVNFIVISANPVQHTSRRGSGYNSAQKKKLINRHKKRRK